MISLKTLQFAGDQARTQPQVWHLTPDLMLND